MAIHSETKTKRLKKEKDLTDFRGTEQPPTAAILDVFNYKAITNDSDHLIVAKNGTYIDLLNIEGRGVWSLTRDQQDLLLANYHYFLQVFLPDHKYLITPFPVDATSQKTYWGRRYIKVSDQLRVERDPNRIKQLQTQLRYIKDKQKQNFAVERKLRSAEFFMLLFGRTKQELRERRNAAINSGGVALVMNQIPLKKKKEILFRINNLNTDIK
ncbi:hypothetical protein ACKN8S_07835 [Limosilactobacillus reuteri]|uniref:hypothetical protein n=1 Tax=Limosilactobacillus reuteri TaxID=1598 RepID=UPI0039BFBCD4